jgi:hypothetical protein
MKAANTNPNVPSHLLRPVLVTSSQRIAPPKAGDGADAQREHAPGNRGGADDQRGVQHHERGALRAQPSCEAVDIGGVAGARSPAVEVVEHRGGRHGDAAQDDEPQGHREDPAQPGGDHGRARIVRDRDVGRKAQQPCSHPERGKHR